MTAILNVAIRNVFSTLLLIFKVFVDTSRGTQIGTLQGGLFSPTVDSDLDLSKT